MQDMPQGTGQQGGTPRTFNNEGARTWILSSLESIENLTGLTREAAASEREGITIFLVGSHIR